MIVWDIARSAWSSNYTCMCFASRKDYHPSDRNRNISFVGNKNRGFCPHTNQGRQKFLVPSPAGVTCAIFMALCIGVYLNDRNYFIISPNFHQPKTSLLFAYHKVGRVPHCRILANWSWRRSRLQNMATLLVWRIQGPKFLFSPVFLEKFQQSKACKTPLPWNRVKQNR